VPVIALVIWIGVMGAAATTGAWVMLSKFSEVFFDAGSWRETKGGRRSRAVLIGLYVLFGLVIVVALAMLVVSRLKPD
jgi:hypothetical protein